MPSPTVKSVTENHPRIFLFYIFLLFLLSLILFSCLKPKFKTEIIQAIDFYDDNNKNIQMAKDLWLYDYYQEILDSIPGFKKENLRYIKWDFFLRDDDKKVLFRIMIDINIDEIRFLQKTITDIIRKKILGNIQFHIENETLIQSLSDNGLKYLSYLNEEQYTLFFERCFEPYQNDLTRFDWIQKYSKKLNDHGQFEKRSVMRRQGWERELYGGTKHLITVFYVSEYSKNTVIDELIFVHDSTDNKWKIIGYRFRECDETCKKLYKF